MKLTFEDSGVKLSKEHSTFNQWNVLRYHICSETGANETYKIGEVYQLTNGDWRIVKDCVLKSARYIDLNTALLQFMD